MKQDWENLGSEYEASSSVVVGDVDCTVHSTVCSKHGVSGYPTIKYYKVCLLYVSLSTSLCRPSASSSHFLS